MVVYFKIFKVDFLFYSHDDTPKHKLFFNS